MLLKIIIPKLYYPRGIRNMSRSDDVLKYIEQKVKLTKLDILKVNKSIYEDFIESVEEYSNGVASERYIDYMSALDSDSSSIAFTYLIEIFRNSYKPLYALKRFFS